MLRNYFRIALRNQMKYKFISFINLFGLTLRLAPCLLILTYILHEPGFDRHNANAGCTYRVTRSFNNHNGVVSLRLGMIAPPFGPLLQNDFSDIKKITILLDNSSTTPNRRAIPVPPVESSNKSMNWFRLRNDESSIINKC